jgi:hypothetical protein
MQRGVKILGLKPTLVAGKKSNWKSQLKYENPVHDTRYKLVFNAD